MATIQPIGNVPMAIWEEVFEWNAATDSLDGTDSMLCIWGERVMVFNNPMSYEDVVKAAIFVLYFPEAFPGFHITKLRCRERGGTLDRFLQGVVGLPNKLEDVATQNSQGKWAFDTAKVTESATMIFQTHQGQGISAENWALFACACEDLGSAINDARNHLKFGILYELDDSDIEDQDYVRPLYFTTGDPYGLDAELKNMVDRWNRFIFNWKEIIDDERRALRRQLDLVFNPSQKITMWPAEGGKE